MTKRFDKLRFNPETLLKELESLQPELKGHYITLILNIWEKCQSQFSFQDNIDNWKKLIELDNNTFLEIRRKLLASKYLSIALIPTKKNRQYEYSLSHR